MDSHTLVTEQLEAGERLLQQLPQDGFDVTTAFWLQTSDDERWYLYLVTPLVEAEGLISAYRRLHVLMRKMPPSCLLDFLKVKLIGPSDALARDVLEAHRRAPARSGGAFRWGGSWLGNMSIEGAYLYPLPAGAPS